MLQTDVNEAYQGDRVGQGGDGRALILAVPSLKALFLVSLKASKCHSNKQNVNCFQKLL